MVFQIVDDVLDLTATDEQLGKPAGHDMEEGVYTLPVIRTLEAAGSDELRSILGKPLGADERSRALDVVRSGEGIASAISTARRFVDDAANACETLGDGPIVQALRDAPSALLSTVMSSADR